MPLQFDVTNPAKALCAGIPSNWRVTLSDENTMQTNARLNEKIVKAVQTSMRIEGYQPVESSRIKERARALMVKRNVRISIPRQ